MSLVLVGVVQDSLEISAAIEDSYDDNLAAHDPESNSRSPLKPEGPESRTNIVAARAACWGGFQRHAGCLDAIDIASGDHMTGSLGNVAVKRKKIGLSLRPKGNFELHPGRFDCLA